MSLELSIEERKLRDFGASVLPPWATKNLAFDEMLSAFAVIFNRCRQQIDFWWDQSFIGRAEGPGAGGPDFLDGLARDLGTGRVAGEGQPALRTRLREIDAAVTRPLILGAIDDALSAAGVAGAAAAVEVRRDRAYLGEYTARTGTGGTFEQISGALWGFTPVSPFPSPLEVGYPRSGAWGNPLLTLSGSAVAGNDGAFEVTDLAGAAAVFTNASASAGLDSTCSWLLNNADAEGNVRDAAPRAFLSRGYRAGVRGVVIILPYGTPAETANAVRESVRQRKAFGFPFTVEVRGVP